MKISLLRLLALVALLALIVLPTQASAKAEWVIDGYVFDSTGLVSQSFIDEFNSKVELTGYPVYLIVVDESLLDVNYYPWDVALNDVVNRGLLPYNYVAFAVAPFVDGSSPVVDYSITELMLDGTYAPLGSLSYPGYSESAGSYIGGTIEDGIIDGDWEMAVLQGVDYTVTAIKHYNLGAPVATIPTQSQQSAPTQQPVIIEKNSIDYSSVFLTSIGVFGGLFLLVFGVAMFSRFYASRRKINDARHRASQSHTAAVNLLSGFDQQTRDAEESLEFLGLRVATSIIAPLRNRITSLKRQAATPLASFESVGERFEKPGSEATEIVYDEIRTQLDTQIVNPMRELMVELKRLVAEVESLETQVETTPDAIATASATIEEAETAIKALEAEMQVPGLRRELAEAEALLVRAQKALTSLNIPTATELAENCLTEAQQALDLARGYKIWIESLAIDHEAVSARIVPIRELIKTAEATLVQLGSEFAESSWDEVSENPGRATKNANRAYGLLVQATKSLSAQDWDEADKEIDEATLDLQEAEMLCKSVSDRQNALIEARKNVVELAATAEKNRLALSNYMLEHQTSIEHSLEEAFNRFLKQLGKALSELESEQPNYIAVSEELRAAIKEASAILDEGKKQVEKMNSSRKTAATELDEAKRAIQRADDHIDDNRRDVGTSAKELLDQAEKTMAAAQQDFQRAERLGDGEEAERIDLYKRASKQADDAEQKAKSALKTAQADVQREESRRRPVYVAPRSDTTVVVVNNTSSYPSTSSRRDYSPPATYRPSPTPTPTRSAPIRSTPVRSTPTTSSITRSTPVRSNPVRSTPKPSGRGR